MLTPMATQAMPTHGLSRSPAQHRVGGSGEQRGCDIKTHPKDLPVPGITFQGPHFCGCLLMSPTPGRQVLVTSVTAAHLS
jgi:hypothetical protein